MEVNFKHNLNDMINIEEDEFRYQVIGRRITENFAKTTIEYLLLCENNDIVTIEEDDTK